LFTSTLKRRPVPSPPSASNAAAIQKTTRLTAFAESVTSRPKPATVLQADNPTSAETMISRVRKRRGISLFLMQWLSILRAPGTSGWILSASKHSALGTERTKPDSPEYPRERLLRAPSVSRLVPN